MGYPPRLPPNGILEPWQQHEQLQAEMREQIREQMREQMMARWQLNSEVVTMNSAMKQLQEENMFLRMQLMEERENKYSTPPDHVEKVKGRDSKDPGKKAKELRKAVKDAPKEDGSGDQQEKSKFPAKVSTAKVESGPAHLCWIPVNPQKEGGLMGQKEAHGGREHPKEDGLVSQQGSQVRQRTSSKEDGLVSQQGSQVRPKTSSKEDGLVSQQGSLVRQKTSSKEDGLVSQQGSLVRQKTASKEDGLVSQQGSLVRHRTSSKEDGLVSQQGSLVRQRTSSKEDGLVSQQGSQVRQRTSSKEDGLVSQQGSQVRQRTSSKEDGLGSQQGSQVRRRLWKEDGLVSQQGSQIRQRPIQEDGLEGQQAWEAVHDAQSLRHEVGSQGEAMTPGYEAAEEFQLWDEEDQEQDPPQEDESPVWEVQSEQSPEHRQQGRSEPPRDPVEERPRQQSDYAFEAMVKLMQGMQQIQSQLLSRQEEGRRDRKREGEDEEHLRSNVELHRLPEWSMETSPVDFADWLLLVQGQLSDLSTSSGEWWETTLEEARKRYKDHLRMSPLEKLRHYVRVPETLKKERWNRLSKRASG